ncbi:Tetratricopeptide TPR_2 [Blastocystis hominis]|uniref:Tetratricopeptide TPR_2 n=1 Tax=Blastocystis hominis TaxID=12968 RepID=D8M8L7_BLAHO|nr:Tetratricopeptide TPR_2 [Blastocystis hominis]CBK24406.2 Tetratricopeptide TPR_2 [Blastocystis hominis]|eukprot:XP_012898454.1 Tetratricopeptide TPR_2 [Blastocystis hominis]
MHILQRKGNRRFHDPVKMVTQLNSWFKGRLHAEISEKSCSMSCQIRIFFEADILLTPHGAGATNMIFMRPRTVFIEAFPPYFLECMFMNLANIVRVHYLSIAVYNETFLAKKVQPGDGEKHYELGIIMRTRRRFINARVAPSPSAVFPAIQERCV